MSGWGNWTFLVWCTLRVKFFLGIVFTWKRGAYMAQQLRESRRTYMFFRTSIPAWKVTIRLQRVWRRFFCAGERKACRLCAFFLHPHVGMARKYSRYWVSRFFPCPKYSEKSHIALSSRLGRCASHSHTTSEKWMSETISTLAYCLATSYFFGCHVSLVSFWWSEPFPHNMGCTLM